jgi:nickel-dependent lactate racemase
MKLVLPYLHKTFPLEIPDENLLAVAEPKTFNREGHEGKEGEDASLRQALANPVGTDGAHLGDFLVGASRVLVIINDATRPTPTPTILRVLMPVFETAGLTVANITLIVATGAHRAPTEGEYRQILGGFYETVRSRCVHHDARNDATVNLGTTRNGTPIELNKRLFDADRIIVTGSVEPHYFAGFTGGR